MYFDTHAHYDSKAFDQDRDTLLASMPEQGVELILNPGCELDSSRKAVEYAKRFDHVYAAVGFHPSDIEKLDDAALEQLRALAMEDKVRAIGEIGLDYYWEDYAPHQQQKAGLYRQMELAQELDLPVIFHDREAHADAMEAVRAYPGVRGVFHCFSGAAQQAKELVDRGWMISFTGALTFPNARRAIEAAAAVPRDRVMIETDSPYMIPYPRTAEDKTRRRNSSLRVWQVAARLAEIWQVSLEEAAAITTENGRRFFRIP